MKVYMINEKSFHQNISIFYKVIEKTYDSYGTAENDNKISL